MQQIGNDKGAGTLTTHYHYDAGGRLIGENDAGGGNRSEYVYLGATPVAVIRNGQAYMIHTDHLDTPRRVTDQNSALLWDWRSADPFGATPPDETAGGSAFVFNLRFPGQYFDKETGLAYNVFRDYDPGTGRYIESDPIGLAAGQMSTYAYVDGNPISYVDPFGLAVLDEGGGMPRQVVPYAGTFGGGTPNEGYIPSARQLPYYPIPARGLPPSNVKPPVKCTEGPASRASEVSKGGKSLWDESGGEWRYYPGDKYHNPHWDYNAHTNSNSNWTNVPAGQMPVYKPGYGPTQ